MKRTLTNIKEFLAKKLGLRSLCKHCDGYGGDLHTSCVWCDGTGWADPPITLACLKCGHLNCKCTKELKRSEMKWLNTKTVI